MTATATEPRAPFAPERPAPGDPSNPPQRGGFGEPLDSRRVPLADLPPAVLLDLSDDAEQAARVALAREREAYERGRADGLAEAGADLADDAAAFARGVAEGYRHGRAAAVAGTADRAAEPGQPEPGQPPARCPVCHQARGPAGICCAVPGPDRADALMAAAASDVTALRRQLAAAEAARDRAETAARQLAARLIAAGAA